MKNASFGIFATAREAYLFLGREWRYLLKLALLPMGVDFISSCFVQFYLGDDVSRLTQYLLSLPASLLFAWYSFLLLRLYLLDERLNTLTTNKEELLDRQRAMSLCVIMILLFNMAMSGGMTVLLTLAESGEWGKNPMLTGLGLFIMGAMFWGVRFAIAPVLATVLQPIKPALAKVEGMMFSLRLIAMGVVVTLPLAAIFELLLSAFVKKPTNLNAPFDFSPIDTAFIITLSTPFSWLMLTVLYIAIAAALREILGRRS